jgi:hypothetical protein
MEICSGAEIYWTTALFIADAKRLGVHLTKNDIAQIRANALGLAASRHARLRRGAMSLSRALEPTAVPEVPAARPVNAPATNEEPRRRKSPRRKIAGDSKLADGVIRFEFRKKAAREHRSGGAA